MITSLLPATQASTGPSHRGAPRSGDAFAATLADVTREGAAPSPPTDTSGEVADGGTQGAPSGAASLGHGARAAATSADGGPGDASVDQAGPALTSAGPTADGVADQGTGSSAGTSTPHVPADAPAATTAAVPATGPDGTPLGTAGDLTGQPLTAAGAAAAGATAGAGAVPGDAAGTTAAAGSVVGSPVTGATAAGSVAGGAAAGTAADSATVGAPTGSPSTAGSAAGSTTVGPVPAPDVGGSPTGSAAAASTTVADVATAAPTGAVAGGTATGPDAAPTDADATTPALRPVEAGGPPADRSVAEGVVRTVEGTSTSPRVEAAARADAPSPAPATPQPPPLSGQLAASLARLRAAPDGQHVLSIRVDPEDLGPVRVTAHIGADGVRIELVGMTDGARDALRGALTELRRELAATGFQADLDLGSEDGTPQERQPERPAGGPARETAPTPVPPAPPAAPLGGHGLDLLA